MAENTPQPDDRAPQQNARPSDQSEGQAAQPSPANGAADAQKSPDAPGVANSTTQPVGAMASEAIEHVQKAAGRLAEEAVAGGSNGSARAMSLPDLTDEDSSGFSDDPAFALLGDVAMKVEVELGRTRMYIEDVLRLNEQSIVELDKAAGDPVDIYVNDRHIARGEVLVVNDNFCVRISELVNAHPTNEEKALDQD